MNSQTVQLLLSQNVVLDPESLVSKLFSRAIRSTQKVESTAEEMEEVLMQMGAERTERKAKKDALVHHTLIPLTKYLEQRKTFKGKEEELMEKFISNQESELYGGEERVTDPRFDCVYYKVKSTIYDGKPKKKTRVIRRKVEVKRSEALLIKAIVKKRDSCMHWRFNCSCFKSGWAEYVQNTGKHFNKARLRWYFLYAKNRDNDNKDVCRIDSKR